MDHPVSESPETHEAAVDAKAGYHHGDLRAALLGAVRALVEERGSQNFSIAEAARKAGVSSAAPYRHFKDKPDILKALVMEAMQDMARNMRAVMAPYPPDSIERINALGRCYIDFARQHPGLFRLVFGVSECHEGDAELQVQGQNVFGVVIETVANYLGIDPADPEAKLRAYMLWTVVHGHSWLAIDGKARQKNIDIPEDEFLSQISAGLIVPYRRT